MTDNQLVIVVQGLPAVIAAVFAGLALLQSRKNGQQAAVIDSKVTTGNEKIDTLHETTNGKMEQLIRATGAAEHAAGKQEERVEERARVDAASTHQPPVEVKVVNPPSEPIPTVAAQ